MANVLQDYFNRMTALNRQRGMTGNMQYGKALDSSLAEGYFDSYQKNKAQSQSLANQKAGLALQRNNLNMQNRALTQSTMLGWAGLGMKGLGMAADYYLARDKNKAIETPVPQNNEVANSLNTGFQYNYNPSTERIVEPYTPAGANYTTNIQSIDEPNWSPETDYSISWLNGETGWGEW
jgi:hypothetical protein